MSMALSSSLASSLQTSNPHASEKPSIHPSPTFWRFKAQHTLVNMAASTSSMRQASAGRTAFSSGSRRVSPLLAPCSQQQRCRVLARANVYEDKEFVKATLEAFPEKGLANAEEARALYSDGGYTYLDVRTTLEVDDIGRGPKGSVNIPVMNAKWKFKSDLNKKEIEKTENTEFVAQVEKRFPNKDAKIMVSCNNGKNYTMKALIALDEAGYSNLVGLKGGYNAWFRTWDNNLRRRRYGEYAENQSGEGSDSCGIHASGAGFDRVDKVDGYIPRNY